MKKYTLCMLATILALVLMVPVCLFLPAPISAVPMLVLAAAAALLSVTALEDGWTHEKWGCSGKLAKDHPVVIIDEELLRGPYREVADVRMPFEPVPPEKFRSQKDVLLYSAAIALLDDALSDEACASLRINRQSFLSRFPVMDEVMLNGFRGLVIRDDPRNSHVYFAGDAALADSCHYVNTDKPHELTRSERACIAALDGKHYAIAAMKEDGSIGPLTYLGSAKNRPVSTLNADAMTALDVLTTEGYDVRYTGSGELVCETGAPIREIKAPAGAGLSLFPLEDGVARFDEALHDLQAYRRSVAALRIRTLVMCLLSVLMGTLLGNVMMGMLGVVLGCFLGPRVRFHAPDRPTALVGAALLTLAMTGLVALFQQVIGASLPLCAFLISSWAAIWVMMPHMGRSGIHWKRLLGVPLVSLLLAVGSLAAGAVNAAPIQDVHDAAKLGAVLQQTLAQLAAQALPGQFTFTAILFGLCMGLCIGLISTLPLRTTPVD